MSINIYSNLDRTFQDVLTMQPTANNIKANFTDVPGANVESKNGLWYGYFGIMTQAQFDSVPTNYIGKGSTVHVINGNQPEEYTFY